MQEFVPEGAVTVRSTYDELLSEPRWLEDNSETVAKYVSEEVSKIRIVSSGVIFMYGHEKQYVPNNEMIDVKWS